MLVSDLDDFLHFKVLLNIIINSFVNDLVFELSSDNKLLPVQHRPDPDRKVVILG